MTITQHISIDLQQPGNAPIVHAVQGEEYTREVKVTLYSGGVAWNPPSNCECVIRYGKPDGKGGIYDKLPDNKIAWSISSNTVTVILAPQMLTVAGIVNAQVEIIVNEKEILSTFHFVVDVEEDASMGAIKSENYANWKTYYIPQTYGAKVGQYLKISNVDADGRIVAVAPVNAPSGEEISNAVDAYLDKHPEITTTLQNGEIMLEKLHDTLKHRVINNYLTPQMFGGVGDGVTDDTQAVQTAMDKAHEGGHGVFFPAGTYMVTSPIKVHTGLEVYGPGATVRKTNTATVEVEGTQVNALFVVTGSETHIHDLRLEGSVSNGVNGITFEGITSMCSFNRLSLYEFNRCFYDPGTIFMCEFDRVHCASSEHAFYFGTSREKTSLVFTACWAENCGQAYDFNRTYYTNLISCGADWCNSTVNSPYTKGYGNPATDKGIYNFNLCRAITMTGCGVENSWGNGAVRCTATVLALIGLVCTNVKSTYQVNPTNTAVGMVLHDGEASRILIVGLCANNPFENTYVTMNHPGTEQYMIAYNYNNKVYGDRNMKAVIVIGVQTPSGPILGGSGKYATECLVLDEYGKVIRAEKYIELDYRKIYPGRLLHSDVETDKISIPFVEQGDRNYCHLIKVTGVNHAHNDNRPWAFEFTMAVASLRNANHADLINPSREGMSVECNGLEAVVTLGQAYTDMLVTIEVISSKDQLIDLDNIKLV